MSLLKRNNIFNKNYNKISFKKVQSRTSNSELLLLLLFILLPAFIFLIIIFKSNKNLKKRGVKNQDFIYNTFDLRLRDPKNLSECYLSTRPKATMKAACVERHIKNVKDVSFCEDIEELQCVTGGKIFISRNGCIRINAKRTGDDLLLELLKDDKHDQYLSANCSRELYYSLFNQDNPDIGINIEGYGIRRIKSKIDDQIPTNITKIHNISRDQTKEVGTTYYPNGNLKTEYDAVNKSKRQYYEDGTLKKEVIEEGVSKTYFPNGDLWHEFDTETKIEKRYSREGDLESERDKRNDISKYYSRGEVLRVEYDSKNKIIKHYDEEGNFDSQEILKEEHGERIIYFGRGQNLTISW
ncbi:MAG: hypothetical protein KAS66_12910 [Candidatus Omnitrophica bacterium]|nr:hypothetical protein [Candidatus Omnitrophota bacterium]